MTLRDMSLLLSALLSLATFSSNHAFGDVVYRSTGPDGQAVYSDRPPSSGEIEKVYSFENLPASPIPEAIQRYRQDLEKSMKSRLSAPRATAATGTQLYSAAWCGYCRKAKAYLAEKGISYQEIDIDTAEGQKAFVLAGGKGGIPLLLSKGRRIQGFTAAAYNDFFRQSR